MGLLGIETPGDHRTYLLETWTVKTEICWEILAPHSQVTYPDLSPLICKTRVITHLSVYCEDEMRQHIQVFRKALTHRDSENVLLFTGMYLFISRISGFILYRTPIMQSSEHGKSLIWGVEINYFSGSGFSQKVLVTKAVHILQIFCHGKSQTSAFL